MADAFIVKSVMPYIDRIPKLPPKWSAAAIVVGSLSIVKFFWQSWRWGKKGLPPTYPAGILETSRKMTSRDGVFWLDEIARELGDAVGLNLHPFINAFVISDYAVTKEIMSDPSSYKVPGQVKSLTGATNGQNTIFANQANSDWLHRRKNVAHAFSSSNIKRMSAVVRDLVNIWKEMALQDKNGGRYEFDPSEDMYNITIHVILQSAFEYDMPRDELKEYIHNIDLVLKEFALRHSGSGALWRRPLGFFIPKVREAKKAAQRIEEIGLKILAAYRNNPNRRSDTVLAKIVANKNYKNDLERVADITTFVVAGHDTTAYSLSWILLNLAKHPNVQAELQSDLVQARTDGAPYRDVLSLKRVIRESMRLNPIGPFLLRMVGREYKVGNFSIPKDSIVIMSTLRMGRHEKVFDNPTEYRPSRWINPTKEMISSVIPFSVGPRSCVGQLLADAEIFEVVGGIISDFDLTVKKEGTWNFFLTLKPDGTRLVATPRK